MRLPLFVGTGVSAGPTNGLLNNITNYWKADTNGAFPDAHGSDDGTINGATFTASAKINGGYIFDGVNDDINFSTPVLPEGPISVSFWVNPDTSTGVEILVSNLSNSLTLFGYNIYLNEGVINFQHGKGGGGASNFNITGATLSTGTWYHIVCLWDATTDTNGVKIYVDGSVSGQGTAVAATTGTPIDNLVLGCLSTTGTLEFDGILDEIGAWNTTLSGTNITDLYNSGSGLSYDSFTS